MIDKKQLTEFLRELIRPIIFEAFDEVFKEKPSKLVSFGTLPKKKPMSVEDVAEMLGISKQTVYQNQKIPRHKRVGRLYFFEDEIMEYIKNKVP